MKRATLILCCLLLAACAPSRRGDDDDTGDPPPSDDILVEVEGRDPMTLSSVYVREELGEVGTMHVVLGTVGLSCAAMRDYWEVTRPAYEDYLATGDVEGLFQAVNAALAELPGMPGWYASVSLPRDFEAGDPLDDVTAGALEYLDDEPEDPAFGPYAIGGFVDLSEVSGSIDALGAEAEGALTGPADWYPNYDPAGPSTSQQLEASVTFTASLCDLEDVQVPDP